MFNGTTKNGYSTNESAIKLTALVQSTPSCKRSTFKIPKLVHRSVHQHGFINGLIAISAFDVDNLRIGEANGRFFSLIISDGSKNFTFRTSFDTKTAEFQLDVPLRALMHTGKYVVWVSNAFGYRIRPGLGERNLPTEDHPATFFVFEPEKEPEEGPHSDLNVVIGGLTGLVFMLLFCYLLFMFRRFRQNGGEISKLVVSVLSVEVLGVLSLLFESWDLFTDSYMLFVKVISAESPCAEKIADLVIPWLCCYVLASLASLVSWFIKVRALIRACRLRREEVEFDSHGNAESVASNLLKHRKNRERTSRAINSIYVGLALGMMENLPLGMLQINHLFPAVCSSRRNESALVGHNLVSVWD